MICYDDDDQFIHVAYRASSAVEAWNNSAVVFEQLAVSSRVFSRTSAGVGALARVEASAAVLARFVIGAVVKILVAEQTTPTLVAVALPRLLARTVQATWIANTLVAQFALPSQFASIES